MTREERLEKMGDLSVEQAKDILVACHEILDRTGIEGAERVRCDDPECISHLTHRIHVLASRYDEARKAGKG